LSVASVGFNQKERCGVCVQVLMNGFQLWGRQQMGDSIGSWRGPTASWEKAASALVQPGSDISHAGFEAKAGKANQ